MSVTARATPNIAFIKYWGNRNEELRLPAADSLSMTLDTPSAEVTVDEASAFSVRSFRADGTERLLHEAQKERFQNVLALCEQYLATLEIHTTLKHLSIVIRSSIPPGIGLASSAAIFSGLAEAITGWLAGERALTRAQVGILARLGSGSAARSVFGGFSALLAGQGGSIDAAEPSHIASEHHWLLHDIVLIPSDQEKNVGSTEGHAIARSSPLFNDRIDAIRTRRFDECRGAILARDFEKLQRISEEDCLDMHRVMETSTPPLKYLSEDTHRIVRGITALREEEHLPVLFTMDAGPTVHLICPEEARSSVVAFAKAQRGCSVHEAKVGEGVKLLG